MTTAPANGPDHTEKETMITPLFPAGHGGARRPGPATQRSLAALEDISELSEQALGKTMRLGAYTKDALPAVRQAAAAALSIVADEATLAAAVHRERTPRDALFRNFRSLDDTLARVHGKLGRGHRVGHPFRRAWTLIGLAITAAAAVLVVLGLWWAAVAVLTGRVAVSVLVGGSHDLPYETQPEAALDPPGTRVQVVGRCIAGHTADALVMFAVCWVLIAEQRPVWALLAVATIVVQLLSTLTRVASLQVGVQLYRLYLERVLRSGSVVVGLALAAAVQPSVPAQGLPLVALACAGPLAYGLGELERSRRRLSFDDARRPLGSEHVRVSVAGPHGTELLRNNLEPGLAHPDGRHGLVRDRLPSADAG